MLHGGGDMLVNLSTLPSAPALSPEYRILRAIPGDRAAVLAFVRENFRACWAEEADYALRQSPVGCLIAVAGKEIVGFACYDVAGKGFFGPIGVLPRTRGSHVGAALLIGALNAMLQAGYGYGIIGWVEPDVAPFYEKTVNAVYIPGGTPENSVFARYIDPSAI